MKSFTPLILIGICIGAYYLYVSPTYTEIKNLQVQKDSYTETLAKAKDVIVKRDSILASYNSLPEEDKNRLNKFLPETFNNVIMANHLNSIANQHGMVIQNIIFTQQMPLNTGEEASTYKIHTASFFIVGSYENFLVFLKDLELNLDLVDIIKLTIAADAKNPKVQNLKFTFELQTYSLN